MDRYYKEKAKEYLDTCEWEDTTELVERRLNELKKLADNLVGDGDTKLAKKTLKAVDQCIEKLKNLREPKPKKQGGKK